MLETTHLCMRPCHGRVAVILPAHNEAENLPATLAGLRRQTRPPDFVHVVSDNSSDRTVTTALSYGATHVTETVNNPHRKAGALNLALRHMLDQVDEHGHPILDTEDMIVVMDADSVLERTWIASALAAMPRNSPVRAVSGMCRGDDTPGALATLQRMEYEQIAALRTRKGGHTRMLSGAASAFRVGTLREVADTRGSRLPGARGEYYNSASLTEDHELTLAIRTLGYEITSPEGCGVRTELLTTWRALAAQRLRWDRGGLADVVSYGITRVTLGHVAYQLERIAGMFVHLAVSVLVTLAFATGGMLVFQPWALLFAFVAALPTVVGVRRMGWRHMLIAGAVLPQFTYYLYLEAVAARAYWQTLTRRATTWAHD